MVLKISNFEPCASNTWVANVEIFADSLSNGAWFYDTWRIFEGLWEM